MLYKLNISRIQEQVAMLRTCHAMASQLQIRNQGMMERFALERAVHLAVECMIDIGNTIIDDFIMRDPGGYLDIVDIMEDEQVIDPSVGSVWKQWILLRDRLVRHYTEVQIDELAAFTEQYQVMIQFDHQVQSFLQAEREKGNIE
ncbi:Uncharacterized conserved protein YutE, UPF0331/DUF86 family [Thermoactinomyces sp. DSM 45891]|uniref:DUF86 domain-containing protein n=1 Tax=Thermoactinomyces sp. DSM 45891 TaxID=1761907 RepID=UPI00091F5C16|nr:HepT-like ribonuclease domain-containing protein [Thermoactinomyces sp. DSM 45891]SFX42197.1 Uncharacterized conserved protein YutE, UPF0331/DUF86 family [Thermoactinomyces sp. DSM 45891]